MIGKIVKNIFGTRNDRLIKQLYRNVEQINGLEPQMQALTDDQLKEKTLEFKQRYGKGESLDSLLVEAFAVVREASLRVMGMRHYDVQLIGGMVLHLGKISEMRTGEGKTLVATLAAYLNALSGKGVHVVTVNDYLARRDAEWMGKIYRFLGLTVGVVVPSQSQDEKYEAYRCDISYCTNNELGFDYLRDNMCTSIEHKMQRPLNFAIIDEVDSILIDEARTPLIISGPAESTAELYIAINKIIPLLKKQKNTDPKEHIEHPGDFIVNEKDKQILLTEEGHAKVEGLLTEEGLLEEGKSLYDPSNLKLYHHVDCCLRAHHLFMKDVDYIVKDDQIVIVDEFTGRTLAGRRWSDGLHQAIEAKEQVEIQSENQTMASITFQNYFRVYQKLSGMTGTADTEASEFLEIYNLEVVIIPSNRKNKRKDFGDQIFLTQKEKFDAIQKDILDCYERGQPVLVGTTSIEVSELISHQLNAINIPHQVLNAKQHEKEAHVVANAGKPKSITIATNMAGRGTDIVLGGNLEMELISETERLGQELSENEQEKLKQLWQQQHDQVIESGGLHIIGTERHESRRIDNQLRGRSGRQGDVGSSRFYLSLEDNLMRIFTPPAVYNMMKKMGMGDGVALEHKLLSRTIEGNQKKVEAHYFDARKNLLQYDNVANEQRRFVYQQRDNVLISTDSQIDHAIDLLRENVLNELMTRYIPPMSMEEQWETENLQTILLNDFDMDIDIKSWIKEDDSLDRDQVIKKVIELNKEMYLTKISILPPDQVDEFERSILLQSIDIQWKNHLASMDYLRQGIHLRSYAQKRPEQEYKREAFEMFSSMLDKIDYQTISILSSFKIQLPEYDHEEQEEFDDEPLSTSVLEKKPNPTNPDDFSMIGRNDPCPCGSGKKFKNCHGQIKN